MIHLRKIAIKPVLYFPPQLIYAPPLYLVTRATNLIDIHSDEHQNRMVKLGKTQDKKTLTSDKTCKNKSRQSELSHRIAAVRATGQWPCRWLIAVYQTTLQSGVTSDHPNTYRCLIHSLLHNTPNLVIHWKMYWQHICQKLSKSAQYQQSYCKNKKGAVFFETQCSGRVLVTRSTPSLVQLQSTLSKLLT